MCSEDLIVDLRDDECSASSVPILEQLQRSAPPPPSRGRRPAMLNKTLPPCSKPAAALPQYLFSQTMPHKYSTKPKRHSAPSSSSDTVTPVSTPRSVTFISNTASSQQKQLRRKTEGGGYMSQMSKSPVLY